MNFLRKENNFIPCQKKFGKVNYCKKLGENQIEVWHLFEFRLSSRGNMSPWVYFKVMQSEIKNQSWNQVKVKIIFSEA